MADKEIVLRSVTILLSATSQVEASSFAAWCLCEAHRLSLRDPPRLVPSSVREVYTHWAEVANGVGAFGGYMHTDIEPVALRDYQGSAMMAFLILSDFAGAVGADVAGLRREAAGRLTATITTKGAST